MEGYEEFSENQVRLLERFVTNTKGNVFCLRNLPEVIKGALFSRYSRSSLGLRSLLLKEFIATEDESAFSDIVGETSKEKSTDNQLLAIRKAQNFYDRILDGYGDDSIGELGGAHLALEHVSMLAAKAVEDKRIGGSPLEKSTRYVYFDQKIGGEYLYYREPILMTSAYRDLYTGMCDSLFEAYGQLIPPMTRLMEEAFPRPEGSSSAAYNASLRAKVLDCLRGLLPASTLTNMGIYGNGRFFEHLIHDLTVHPLAEMQEIGRKSQEELTKLIPSFVRRSDSQHHTHSAYIRYREALCKQLSLRAESLAEGVEGLSEPGVKLLHSSPDAVKRVAAALLFEETELSLEQLDQIVGALNAEEITQLIESVASPRESRRHKSPRALEFAEFTFEILADFGAYRDLHRHRMLTQERQFLTCNYGYYVPPEILDTEMEAIYREVLDRAKGVYDQIARELPEEAQYVVPMAYNVRWYFHLNLRALQWLVELRSQAAGHPTYRKIAQEMAKAVKTAHPQFEPFLSFVDYSETELGRLASEERSLAKATRR